MNIIKCFFVLVSTVSLCVGSDYSSNYLGCGYSDRSVGEQQDAGIQTQDGTTSQQLLLASIPGTGYVPSFSDCDGTNPLTPPTERKKDLPKSTADVSSVLNGQKGKNE